MFINKKNVSNHFLSSRSLSTSYYASSSFAHGEPFKILDDDQKHLNKKAFDGMLERVFANLDSASPDALYSISDKFVYNPLKKLLKEKGKFYNDLYSKINDFYKYHPFDTEKILSQEMKDFLLEWPLENIVGVPAWVSYLRLNTLEEFIIAIFVPKFLEHIQKEMNDEINTQNSYIKFGDIIRDSLRSRLGNWLISIYTVSFNWNSFPKLSTWIHDFNYKKAQQLNATNIYDELFDRSLENQSTSTSKNAFTNNNLKNYLDLNLNPNSKTLMRQMVLHLIFEDNVKFLQTIKRGGSLEDAEELIEDIENKRDPTESLNVFLPGIKDAIKKLNLYWNVLNPKKGGLVISRVGETLPWLVPKNASNSIFDLNFSLRFLTEKMFLPYQVVQNVLLPHNVFQINPINKIVPVFDQARDIVNDFISKIVWKRGYLDSHFWTEKDIVDWVDEINNFEELIAILRSYRNKTISPIADYIDGSNSKHGNHNHINIKNYWSNFTNTSLNLDFSSIDDPNYIFQVEPELCFAFSKAHNDFSVPNVINIYPFTNARVVIYFKLKQILKNDPLSQPKKTKSFVTNNPYKILPMLNWINLMVDIRFPEGISYKEWENKGNSFWQNEFFKNMSSPKSLINRHDDENKKRLKTQEDVFKRSNIRLVKEYIELLINLINNQYRNDFSFNIEPKLQFYLSNKKLSGSNVPKISIISEIHVKDSGFERLAEAKFMTGFIFKKSIVINDLKSFGLFPKAIDGGYIHNTLKKLSPIKQINELEVGLPISDNFLFRHLDGNTVSIANIKDKFKSFGFKKVKISVVKQGDLFTSNKKYVHITYEVQYHNFITGLDSIYLGQYKLVVEFEGVSSEFVQKTYDDIIKNLNPFQKKDKNLRNAIDNIFDKLKDPNTKTWYPNVDKNLFDNVLNKVYQLIADFSEGVDIIKKLEKLYNGNVPKKIMKKLLDPAYADVFRKILEQQDKFSKEKIKNILANDKLLKFLKNIKIEKMQQTILDILKFQDNTKYAYFGTGAGLGLAGLLSSGASIKWARLNSKSKKIQTSFIKNKYISIVAASVSLTTFVASVILMFIFFVSKGGF